jgi:hypothetical protein
MDNLLNTPLLFRHQYDIDVLLHALCTAPADGVVLDTTNGTLHAPPLPEAPHRFEVQALPASILAEMARHPLLNKLTEADQAQVQTWLKSTPVAGLPALFGQGYAGGWLRERVKDYALEWLDARELIPPSMRHIPRASAPERALRPGQKIRIGA